MPERRRRAAHASPIISIITTTFNQRPYIQRCLESTIEQTEARWEQIVIDDGSTDGTEEEVLGVSDPRIRYIRRRHEGILHLADAYNTGLALARGEFVAVLEGDDFWPVDKLERQMPAFERPEVVLSWGRASVTNAAGDVQRNIPTARLVTNMKGQAPGETLRSLLHRNYIPACTVICRREALLAVGGFQQPRSMPTTDYPTWLELCRVGAFAPVNQVLGFHRRHDAQVTVQMRQDMLHVLEWGPAFVDRLSPGERDTLGVSTEEARKIDRHNRASLAFSEGRAALRDSRNAAAEALFRKALRAGSTGTRVEAVLALGCSVLGFDLERIAEIEECIRAR